MTFLITGGAGFIGANFVKYVLQYYPTDQFVVLDKLTYAGNLGTIQHEIQQPNCIFVKGDICDQELVAKLFENQDIGCVVNFAAESHVDRSIENPQLFLQTNVLGTQNLLDIAKRNWITGSGADGYPLWKQGVRFHQVSTDEVYGSLGKTGFFTEMTPLNPHSPYSASKAAADLIVMAYADTYHMPVSITRCSNNYGPFHFPEKLIPLIIKNVLEGKPLPVYGDGSNVRDWLFVADHCKAIDAVIRHGRAGQVYNVGGHNEQQNIEVVKVIIRTVQDLLKENPTYRSVLQVPENQINDQLITFVKDRLGHDQRYAIDPSKITRELGWKPTTDFETGVRQTVKWYLENQSWVEEITKGDYVNYYEKMYKGRELVTKTL